MKKKKKKIGNKKVELKRLERSEKKSESGIEMNGSKTIHENGFISHFLVCLSRTCYVCFYMEVCGVSPYF